MSPSQAAHLRLLSQLPVRTHIRQYQDRQQGKRFQNGVVPPEVVEEFKEYRAAGMVGKRIRNRLRIGSKTYSRILAILEGQ